MVNIGKMKNIIGIKISKISGLRKIDHFHEFVSTKIFFNFFDFFHFFVIFFVIFCFCGSFKNILWKDQWSSNWIGREFEMLALFSLNLLTKWECLFTIIQSTENVFFVKNFRVEIFDAFLEKGRIGKMQKLQKGNF